MLDPGLTTTLLGSYGRLDDLVYYATLRQASVTRSYTHTFTTSQCMHVWDYKVLQNMDSALVMRW